MNYAIELASPKKQRMEYSENRIYKCDINPKIKSTNLTILCPGTDLKTKIKHVTKYTPFLSTNMYGSHRSKAMCKWRLVLSECSCTVFVSNYVRKLEFLKSLLFPD